MVVPSKSEAEDLPVTQPSEENKEKTYSSKAFWDKRFGTKDKNFDWYASFSELKIFFHKHAIPKTAKILVIGAGTSQLSPQLHAAGYTDLLSIDISGVCINEMRSLHPDLRWQEADATNMRELADNSFDLVIDKGTLDALSCNETPELVKNLIGEMGRVCKAKSGHVMLISHSKSRDKLFYEEAATKAGRIAELEIWDSGAEKLEY